MYSMIKSYEKCLRYYTFNKSAPNHRSLTLRWRLSFLRLVYKIFSGPTKKQWRSAIILSSYCDPRSQRGTKKQWRFSRSAAGSRRSQQDRDDRGRIATIAAGSRRSRQGILRCNEMGLQLFFISRLFIVRFSNGFQENDVDTLLSTVRMSDKIYFFPFMLRITAFPHAFVSLYICFKCKSTWGLKSQLHLLSLFICKYIQADSSMLSNFWI